MRVRIVGTGRAVPEKILTNADLEKMVETTDDWITSRSGIKERRIAHANEALSDFAVPACRQALDMAGIPAETVDLVICATVSPDTVFPATATTIQNELGARRAAAFDVSAACTGFVYGVGIAEQFLRTGWAKTAVVVGGEILSKFVDWNDRSTCVLFGDGAAAVVMVAGHDDDERGILRVSMHSDGSLGELIIRPGGGSRVPPSRELYDSNLSYIRMRGNETFKVAVRTLAEVSDEALGACGLRHQDVDWFIPHQANRRIIDAVGQRLEIPKERIYVNIERYGNTSAASIPIALDELNRDGKLQPGHIVLFSAFGAGLTWGAGVVRW